jgi:hypothetical protein
MIGWSGLKSRQWGSALQTSCSHAYIAANSSRHHRCTRVPGAITERLRDGGMTDTEIRIGNFMPYSGPLEIFGEIGKAEAAYFELVNDRGEWRAAPAASGRSDLD